ncbi:peptide ABC transporter permease protein [Gottschalkia purinilytica]|uniref:Peptide ABC transporter permease protein n=1 Tax=Gottschalkia purinilytica TaxID=1503 RepID=A0A0L0W755_GOTPU|nr:ABC transporter permease [Gottschalkia purinilytica]KNF07311.1 peptide ABC transporter permease protein [Gottschalkia purinilytica]
MKKTIVKRVLQSIPILIAISIISFFLIQLSPGDPINSFITPEMSERQVMTIRKDLGLDKPITVQYFYWVKNLLKGNLGYSYVNNQSVLDQILERLPATIGLMGTSLVIAIVVSIPLGIISAIHKNKFIDKLISNISYIGISIPSFWFGIILIYIFSSKLKMLPSMGMRTIGVDSITDLIRHGIMPTLVLSFMDIAVFTRYIRSSVIEQLKEGYVVTGYSKGLSRKYVLYFHILKNSLLPIITILGMSLPRLVTGAIITETIFGWPGIGRLGVSAVFSFDYPVIMATTMISSILLLTGNLIADIAYYFVDPRIRY